MEYFYKKFIDVGFLLIYWSQVCYLINKPSLHYVEPPQVRHIFSPILAEEFNPHFKQNTKNVTKICKIRNVSFIFQIFLIKIGGQNFERRNVERPVFGNFEIANMKIKKNELFDNFIFELFCHFFRKLFENLKYLMIFDIVKY